MKRIIVERGETSRIARLFTVTDQAVRDALKGKLTSERGQQIREEAMRAGGFYVPRRRKPVVQTQQT
jgi:hypothetical protein